MSLECVSVAYQNIVPVLVEAIKQQQKQMETLQTENAALKALHARLDTLTARLEASDVKTKPLPHHSDNVQPRRNKEGGTA